MCNQGVAHHLFYHQRRLDSTLQKFNISTSYNLSELINPPDAALYRCRFLYDEAQCSIEYHPYIPKKIISLRLIQDNTIKYSSKYSDRSSLDKLFDARDGCDDILIVQNGCLTDTTIANIAFFINNQWFTPETPLLEGTTRSRLIDEGKITPAVLSISDALKAPKIALMNAMIGFIEMDNGIIAQT
ncbi:MAG: aminotransferase class IV [Sulfuricurvum sp.]|nr:aminotransferase class IV [Sulfuricurvum sp.]